MGHYTIRLGIRINAYASVLQAHAIHWDIRVQLAHSMLLFIAFNMIIFSLLAEDKETKL